MLENKILRKVYTQNQILIDSKFEVNYYYANIGFINYKENILYLNTFSKTTSDRCFIIYDFNNKKIIAEKIITEKKLELDGTRILDSIETNKGCFFVYKTSDNTYSELEKIVCVSNELNINEVNFIEDDTLTLIRKQLPNTLTYFDYYYDKVKTVNLETKKTEINFILKEEPNIKFMHFTYSPCHKYILASDLNVLYIWEAETGKLFKKLEYEEETPEYSATIGSKLFNIMNIQFSHNGKYLLLPCDYYGDCEKSSLCYVIDFESMEVIYRIGDIYFNSKYLNPNHLLYFTDFGVKNALISCNDKYVFLDVSRLEIIIVFELETGEIKDIIDGNKYTKIFLDPENENRFKAFTTDGFFIEAEFEY